MTADAVVIGAGPNGLVAANLLADAGWDVLVVEGQDEPGGAVRSAELIENGLRQRSLQLLLSLHRSPPPCSAAWSSSGTDSSGAGHLSYWPIPQRMGRAR